MNRQIKIIGAIFFISMKSFVVDRFRYKLATGIPPLLGFILSIIATVSVAQTQDIGAPIITNYDAKQYKAHSQNWVSVQDRRGVMYFGNSSGILEFDGQRWQVIPTAGNPMIRSLAMGQDGTIFYGAVGDFGYLSTTVSGKVIAISLKTSIPKDEQIFNDVWQIESTSQGIYFLTRSRIFRFAKGKITALPGKLASSQATIINGNLFYADSEQGISLIDGDNIIAVPQLAGVYNNRRIVMAAFGQHELLVGRLSGDFVRINLLPLWDESTKKYIPSRPATDLVHAFPTELDAFLNENRIFVYKLLPLGSDSFVVSSIKAGIITFDRNGKILRAFNKNSGLLDNTVAGIMVDRFNNLWASTNSGISYIELSVPQSVFGGRNGIEGISISAAYHKNRLYVGTFQNIFVQTPFHYSLNNDVPKFVPLKDGPSEVWQFMEVDGDLMAASGRGLFRIEDDAAFKVSGASGAYCLGYTPLWPHHIFVGLMGGIEVYKKEAGQWSLIGRLDGVKENVRKITTDNDGQLWLNTEVKGLLRTHFSGSKPTQVASHRIGLEHGLPDLSASRTSIIDSTLYLVSPKGLYRATLAPWTEGESDASHFNPDLAIGKSFMEPPIAISDIVVGEKNSILVTTAAEVTIATPNQDGVFKMNANPFAGLGSPDSSLFLHPNGGIWLLGESLFRVDTALSKNYVQAFDAMIRKIVVNGKRALFEGTHGVASTALPSAMTVFTQEQTTKNVPELPYSENALSFEFAAAFFEKPGTTRFQYWLKGFDKDWSNWDAAAVKEYTNIPEGKYEFRVRAKNLYGTLGQEANFSFRILPPWYRTVWAYLLWILGGGAILVGIVHLYTLKLRQEKVTLEALVAVRTQQLRDASLTDPLTGLRNRRFISEILQTDVTAFVGYKNYLIGAKNNRSTMVGTEVFGLFLLDMDHFKLVNDTYGHDAGDQVLKQFAEILKASVRKDDVVIRLGGEEFLVVLKKTFPEYLHTFAMKLLESVATKSFDLGNGTHIHKTCSIGYTAFPIYQNSPTTLSLEQGVMVADMAMYYAKSHGRNQAIFLEEGHCVPEDEDLIKNAVTSLDFALKANYLKVGKTLQPPQ